MPVLTLILGILAPIIKPILEVFADVLFKQILGPSTVAPEVKPVLQSIGVQSDNEHSAALVDQYGNVGL